MCLVIATPNSENLEYTCAARQEGEKLNIGSQRKIRLSGDGKLLFNVLSTINILQGYKKLVGENTSSF